MLPQHSGGVTVVGASAPSMITPILKALGASEAVGLYKKPEGAGVVGVGTFVLGTALAGLNETVG